MERHYDYYKAYQIAEPVVDHVREVEAVPDIVELTDNKAEEHEQNKSEAGELFPELYLL